MTFRRLAQEIASSFQFTIVMPAVFVLIAGLFVAVDPRRWKFSVQVWRWCLVFCGSDFFRGYDFTTDKLFWLGVALVFSHPWRRLLLWRRRLSWSQQSDGAQFRAKAATKRWSATVTAVGPKRISNEQLVKLGLWELEFGKCKISALTNK